MISSYGAINIETIADDYNASLLSPTSNLVFQQWNIDANNELLIAGYHRQTDVNSNILSSDLIRIISSFYDKMYSITSLVSKINHLERLAEYRRQQRRDKCIQITHHILCGLFIFFAVIVSISFLFGTDIAALFIATTNNCDLTIGVNQFLYIGSISHLIALSTFALTIALVLVALNNDLQLIICGRLMFDCSIFFTLYFWGSIVLFFISYAILGAILYSKMDQNTVSNKQCANTVISWVVLKLLLYIILLFVMSLWLMGLWRYHFPAFYGRDVVGKEVICYIIVILFVILFIFAPDISALIAVCISDCDEIDEYLIIGSIVHLVIWMSIICILVMECTGILINSTMEYCVQYSIMVCIVINWIFCVCWCSIGVYEYLYTETISTNCSIMMLSWIVIRYIECVTIAPFLLYKRYIYWTHSS